MTLGEIAGALGLQLSGDEAVEIKRLAPLAEAGDGDISFVANVRAAALIPSSKASALIVPKGISPDRPSIIADNPLLAMAKVAGLLRPEGLAPSGIHPSAVVHEKAMLGDGVSVGPFAIVGEGATISDGSVIKSGAKIGADVVVGSGTVIFENVVIYDNCEIGAGCRVHANTTIGADGFGYVPLESGENFKIPQIGIVRIEDGVEIGANSSIDRATLGVTLIKRGVKIDNQVQIGHNCVIGENVIIAGCTGIAGSAVIGDNVKIGGMVAIADHVKIAPGTLIAGKTGVHGDIKKPGVYTGPMAMKNMEYKRFMLSGRTLEKIKKKVRMIEKKLGMSEGED